MTKRGRVMVDRQLYLPRSWTEDAQRRERAHVPEDVTFQTKPQQALAMLTRQYERGLSFAWVTADCVYGGNPKLRNALIKREQRFVMEVSKRTQVWTRRPRYTSRKTAQGQTQPFIDPNGPRLRSVQEVVEGWKEKRWRRIEVGQGSKGRRCYDWAARRVIVSDAGTPGHSLWLLARRSISTGELAYYLCYAPAKTPLLELARVAASRWPIEEVFREAKGEAGLDEYQVRTWQGWHRHTLLAMLAHLFLIRLRQALEPLCDAQLIDLTLPEVRRLFELILCPRNTRPDFVWHWHTWRRRHQHRARLSHYRRQEILRPNLASAVK